MNNITLTLEQSTACEKITEWFKTPDKPSFHFGGYAGTGKTTVIKSLCSELGKDIYIIVSAFTGKACSVLQRKDVFAQTLHSLIYDVEIKPDGGVEFYKKSRLEGCPQLIIVDEASMISTELYNDLMSFKVKVLFVGDPAQLEPVGDNPNLMKRTDFVLTKIHRQAEESPIISLASRVRLGAVPMKGEVPGLTVKDKSLTSQLMLAADQIICAKNKTRTDFNSRFRQHFKYKPHTVVEGEKLICLRNNGNFGIFNGQIFRVTKITGETKFIYEANITDEIGKEYTKIPIWKEPFESPVEKDTRIPREWVYFDYGYVITCHKSQGSEWDSVLVYDEPVPSHIWDMKRWRYTAITRASKNLVYCI